MATQATPPTVAGAVPLAMTTRLCALALGVGVVAGAAAYGYVALQHEVTHWLWHVLPGYAGFTEAPWWMVLLLPVVGALLTFATFRLPGHGGHSPLVGLSRDVGPRELVSALAAALASLSFGAVLGPEAPLLAVGTAAGALAFRANQPVGRQVMMIVGAMAAAGALFGNPLITSILMLEVALAAGATMASPMILLPSLVGLGASYVLQVGLGQWAGLGATQMALPALAAYPNVRLVDLAVATPLAIAVAALAILARLGALRVEGFARRSPLPTILLAAGVTGLCALAVTALTGMSYELVLFSGQTAMTEYLGLTALGTGIVVLVAKLIAYAACMGGGFRGGPMFPAIAIGTILAAMASPLVGQGASTALVAAAIAAATSAGMRFPFTGVLIGVLLTITAGPAATVPAIIGAVVGMLIRLAAERRLPVLAPGAPVA